MCGPSPIRLGLWPRRTVAGDLRRRVGLIFVLIVFLSVICKTHEDPHLRTPLHERLEHAKEAWTSSSRSEGVDAPLSGGEPDPVQIEEEVEEEDDDDSKPWPLVYFYQLPDDFHDTKLKDPFNNYVAEIFFPWWLRISGHTTDDPEKADLYFPLLYNYHSGAFYHSKHPGTFVTLEAFEIVQRQYPYWNRSGGADHIWIFTQDHGFCGFYGNQDFYLPELQPSIIMSHWGYMDVENFCDMDQLMNGSRCMFEPPPRRRLPCFVPVKDTVIPAAHMDSFEPHRLPFPVDKLDPLRPRKNRLFFSGSLESENPLYSVGVRQLLYVLFKNHTGFRLIDKNSGEHANYAKGFEESTFCLAATGYGWGVRGKLSLAFGCIPVLIADDTQFPLEDVLPWEDFSLRLPSYMMHRLPEAMELIASNPDKLARMQKNVACVWRYFSWQRPFGRAGEAVLCSLRRKLAGWDLLKPSMDWDSCTLNCTVPKHLRRSRLQELRKNGSPVKLSSEERASWRTSHS